MTSSAIKAGHALQQATQDVLVLVYPELMPYSGVDGMADVDVSEDFIRLINEIDSWPGGVVFISRANSSSDKFKKLHPRRNIDEALARAANAGLISIHLKSSSKAVAETAWRIVRDFSPGAATVFHVSGNWHHGCTKSSYIGKVATAINNLGYKSRLSAASEMFIGRQKERSRRTAPEHVGVRLFDAAANGSIEDVRQALSMGGDTEFRSYDGLTPLQVAAIDLASDQQKYLSILNLLLDSGADPGVIYEPEGSTLLHLVAGYGDINIIERLLKANVDMDALDAEGRTALHMAASRQCPESCVMLFLYGCDPTIKDKDGNSAADMCSTGEEYDRKIEITAYVLMAYGAKFSPNNQTFIARILGRKTMREAAASLGLTERLLYLIENEPEEHAYSDSLDWLIRVANIRKNNETLAALQAYQSQKKIKEIARQAAANSTSISEQH